MSLDKLDHATTARYTLRINDESVAEDLKTTIQEIFSGKAAQLTTGTMEISVDLTIDNVANVSSLEEEQLVKVNKKVLRKFIDMMEATDQVECLSANTPEL